MFMITDSGHFGVFALSHSTAKIMHVTALGVNTRKLVLNKSGDECVDSR